jgi:hypothetical protein
MFEKAQAKLLRNSHDREYLRYSNFISGLDHTLDEQTIKDLVVALTEKHLVCTKRDIDIEIPKKEDITDVSDPYKLQKYVATQLLLEEGFTEEDISYDRVFVNADKTEVYAHNSERKIYVDCMPSNVRKIKEYTDNDIEYWLMIGDEKETIKCYVFRKSES